jgi:2-iminoacetate synthase
MVNIGPLVGIGEVRSEVFLSGLHARYLQDNFLETEISLSLPRMNPAEGGYQPDFSADDRTFVQFMTALRCYLPRVGLAISTRESAAFRDNLIPLGVTRFSAGSCTGVGGYSDREDAGSLQFAITDERSVAEVVEAIRGAGYQPVYKDWDSI